MNKSKTFNVTVKKTREFEASVASMLVFSKETGGGGSGSVLNDGVTSLTLISEEDGELMEMTFPIIYKYFGDVDPGLDRLGLDMFGVDATVPFFYMFLMPADEAADIPSLLNAFTDPSIFVDMIKKASNIHSFLIDVGDIQEFTLKNCLVYDRSDYPDFGENKVYVKWSIDFGGGTFYEVKIEFNKDIDRWENQWVRRVVTDQENQDVKIEILQQTVTGIQQELGNIGELLDELNGEVI